VCACVCVCVCVCSVCVRDGMRKLGDKSEITRPTTRFEGPMNLGIPLF